MKKRISACPIGSMDLPDNDYTMVEIPRYLGEDGANVFIEIQGTLVVVTVRTGPRICKTDNKRGKCLPFSASSRLRLLRLVNRLDWAAAGKSSFITLTYTDRTGRPSPEEITYHRSRFQAWFEEQNHREVCGLWRVEWMDRLKGRFVGQPMPHVHVISFNCEWVDKWEVKSAWMRIIGERKSASTDIRGINDLRHCMYYIGKYIGKMPEMLKCSSLGIEAYLNIGRAWGKYRPELLPLSDRVYFRVQNNSLVKRIRAIAKAAWKGCPDCERMGFSVFGSASKKIAELCEEYSGQSVRTGIGFHQPLGRSAPIVR